VRLDRNEKGHGKYGLIKRRELEKMRASWIRTHNETEAEALRRVEAAIALLEVAGLIDWGETPESEFFVIRLKDRFARAALRAYSLSAQSAGLATYGNEVGDLANRSSLKHPNCKFPD
jgi:uncharacterized protein (DUF924 family)